MPEQVLVIACGALAREINDLKRINAWEHMHLSCIDAKLHNRPALIPERLRQKIRRYRTMYDRIYVAYADCGTGGEIDKVIAEEGNGIERLPGSTATSSSPGEPGSRNWRTRNPARST